MNEPSSLGRLAEPTLAETAYQTLEARIVTLALEPGSVVSESGLAEELGVGRTPLREGLQRLAADGLVRVMPRRGVMIAPLDLTEILQVIEVRKPLDRIVLRGAAASGSSKLRQSLAHLLPQLSGQERRFMEVDAEIDRVIWMETPNQHGVRAVRPLHSHCRRFWYKFRGDEDLARSADLHHAVVEAILRGDGEVAAARSDKLLEYLTLFTKHILIAG